MKVICRGIVQSQGNPENEGTTTEMVEATKGNEEMTMEDLAGITTIKVEMTAGELLATKPIKMLAVAEAGVRLPSKTVKLKVEAGISPLNQKKMPEEVAGTQPKQLHPRRTTEEAGEPTETARRTAVEVDGELSAFQISRFTHQVQVSLNNIFVKL